jgi:Major capsid protein N-terminus/Large eukaryotic DNA virus major capsid protein
MTGGGLYVLISYGTQNVIMSGNPQMTYYYKIFRRYSHFSMENVSIALDGPNLLSVDNQIQLTAKIQRIGDLMSDMFFSFTIPDIYSKYVKPTGLPTDRNKQYEFQWVKALGAAIINSVEFFIGGQSIQRFDGTYLYSKAQLEYDTVTYEKWSILVGNTNELNNPSTGAFQANSTFGPAYPTVVPQATTGQQQNRPSIPGQTIHVPLNFWFTDSTFQALPLIALQYQDCNVVITLNPVQSLYTILDPSGNRVAPNYTTASVNQNNPSYTVTKEQTASIQNFLTDIGYTNPLTTWPLNPMLQCTFVYLSDEERITFASRPLTYVLPQLRIIPLGPVTQTSQTFDLEVTNPISRLIFITRRSDWKQRNDFTNFTNWYSYPFAPSNTGVLVTTETPSSGVLITNSQKDIIKSARVLVNGNEIQEVKPTDFLTKIYPFRYTTGSANAEIPIYTWAITSSKTQPSGSLNASRITNFQLEANFYNLPSNSNYVYNFDLYVESINFLVIVSGSGSTKYAL